MQDGVARDVYEAETSSCQYLKSLKLKYTRQLGMII